MEDLIAQFPTKDTTIEHAYRSFIYQPERLALTSRPFLQQRQSLATQFLQADYYYSFNCELKSPLLGVKSIELLRCSLPAAFPNIPNGEACFYYYRIPADPVTYQPQYNTLTAANIHVVRLLPSPPYSPDNYPNPNIYGWNTTFGDYQSLVDQLNLAAQNDPNQAELIFFTANDITFYYDQVRNKIGFTGKNAKDIAGFPQYYYLPVGYKDPNLLIVQQAIQTTLADPTGILFPTNGLNTLNRRLGFLWDGDWGLPAAPANPSLGYNILYARTAPKPNFTGLPWTEYLPNYTAETFTDLVNTGNIYIYCDAVGGSTQDINADERLLAIVGGNAATLGIIFGESKIQCQLTKTSQAIFQLNITLRTDTGDPLYLPKSAFVNLELKISY